MTMNVEDIYLLCFAMGALWSFAALLLGRIDAGNFGHSHIGHSHAGHLRTGRGALVGAKYLKHGAAASLHLLNPSCAAVFLAWFGGVGYLLERHTGLGFWAGLCIAAALGLTGAWILASLIRFLRSREQPLDPADYEIVGVLGRISAPIRKGGVGELIYIRDGARRALSARSEDGQAIGRNEEAVVIRYEKGIAYVRAWDAMTR
jgi:membrane protein implicated in regulation of membrane protease activity